MVGERYTIRAKLVRETGRERSRERQTRYCGQGEASGDQTETFTYNRTAIPSGRVPTLVVGEYLDVCKDDGTGLEM